MHLSGPGISSVTCVALTDGADPASPLLYDGYTVYTPGISERPVGGATTFYHQDALGSVAATTNAGQQQTTDVRYTAFGTEQSYNGSLNTFGWNGKSQYQKDRESGLMLLGHRYYDQSTGRFLSEDPAGDGANWYAYCENNPLTAVDPDGLTSKSFKAQGRTWQVHLNDVDTEKGANGEHADAMTKGKQGTSRKDYITSDGVIHDKDGNKVGRLTKSERDQMNAAFEKARDEREAAGRSRNPKENREGMKDPKAQERSNTKRDTGIAGSLRKPIPGPVLWWVFPIKVFNEFLYGKGTEA